MFVESAKTSQPVAGEFRSKSATGYLLFRFRLLYALQDEPASPQDACRSQNTRPSCSSRSPGQSRMDSTIQPPEIGDWLKSLRKRPQTDKRHLQRTPEDRGARYPVRELRKDPRQARNCSSVDGSRPIRSLKAIYSPKSRLPAQNAVAPCHPPQRPCPASSTIPAGLSIPIVRIVEQRRPLRCRIFATLVRSVTARDPYVQAVIWPLYGPR